MRENQPIFANDAHYFAEPAGKPAARFILYPRSHPRQRPSLTWNMDETVGNLAYVEVMSFLKAPRFHLSRLSPSFSAFCVGRRRAAYIISYIIAYIRPGLIILTISPTPLVPQHLSQFRLLSESLEFMYDDIS